MKNRTLILFILLNVAVLPNLFSQNIAINSTGSLPDTSAMLDVSSTTLGFLMPRMTTVQQNAIILPATGLAIFNTTSNSVMINTGTAGSPVWSPLSVQGLIDTSSITNFYLKVQSLFSATAPIIYSNGLIGITQATTSTNGYLNSTDWNTFNNKVSSITSGDLSETASSVLTISGGTGAVLGAGTTLEVKQANGSQDGFISGTDWTTFNSKLSTIDTTNINNFSTKVQSLFSAISPITYTNGLIGITRATTSTNGYLDSTDWNNFNNKVSSITSGDLSETASSVLTISGGTGAVLGAGTTLEVKQANGSQDGFISGTDWTTFNSKLSTIDTTNINNFSTKVQSLFSAASPIAYTNGLIGISRATTSTNGYLDSTDWKNFNNKVSSIISGDLSESVSSVLTISGGTAAVLGTGTTVEVKQASGSQNGFLSSTDWTTFNSKLSTGVTTQTTTYTPTVSDYTIVCNNGSAMAVNLPSAAGIAGKIYIIKKISGTGINVIVTAIGGEFIDGAATQTLPTQYDKLTIQSDGTNWIILSN